MVVIRGLIGKRRRSESSWSNSKGTCAAPGPASAAHKTTHAHRRPTAVLKMHFKPKGHRPVHSVAGYAWIFRTSGYGARLTEGSSAIRFPPLRRTCSDDLGRQKIAISDGEPSSQSYAPESVKALARYRSSLANDCNDGRCAIFMPVEAALGPTLAFLPVSHDSTTLRNSFSYIAYRRCALKSRRPPLTFS